MILVTGGTGFLGSYIIQQLVEQGYNVRAIKRNSSRLPFYISADILNKVEWVDGDVLDVFSLDDAMKGIDIVIHAAAIVSFHQRDKLLMTQTNVDGTANVYISSGQIQFMESNPGLRHLLSSRSTATTRLPDWSSGSKRSSRKSTLPPSRT